MHISKNNKCSVEYNYFFGRVLRVGSNSSDAFRFSLKPICSLDADRDRLRVWGGERTDNNGPCDDPAFGVTLDGNGCADSDGNGCADFPTI